MIGDRIVISDTNILLDLISQNMLGVFFSLPYSFCTTDFVIGEIERQACSGASCRRTCGSRRANARNASWNGVRDNNSRTVVVG